MNRSLSLVTVVVDDYDTAIAHYVDDLGFDLVEDTPQGTKRWVVVSPGGATGLLLAQAVNARQRSRIGNQTGGRVSFFLETDDFDASHREMTAAGVNFTEDPRRESYGTVAVFEDRYGNRWDLLEPAPAGGESAKRAPKSSAADSPSSSRWGNR